MKLAFYNRSCRAGQSCEASAADVARIVRAIEKMWNTGQKVKCYTFEVKVDARSVADQSGAGQNEVDVGLDYGPVAVRAFVHGEHHVSTTTSPLSNSPDDRVDPVHDPASPTTGRRIPTTRPTPTSSGTSWASTTTTTRPTRAFRSPGHRTT